MRIRLVDDPEPLCVAGKVHSVRSRTFARARQSRHTCERNPDVYSGRRRLRGERDATRNASGHLYLH
jgi:hypothetical protein